MQVELVNFRGPLVMARPLGVPWMVLLQRAALQTLVIIRESVNYSGPKAGFSNCLDKFSQPLGRNFFHNSQIFTNLTCTVAMR